MRPPRPPMPMPGRQNQPLQSVRPAAAVPTFQTGPLLACGLLCRLPALGPHRSHPPRGGAELYLELQKYEQATKELQLLLEGGDATDGVELEELHLRVKALLLLSRVHKEQVSVARTRTRQTRRPPASHPPSPSPFTSRQPPARPDFCPPPCTPVQPACMLTPPVALLTPSPFAGGARARQGGAAQGQGGAGRRHRAHARRGARPARRAARGA